MRHNCDTHIDYIIPNNNPLKKSMYTSFIAKECNLQGIQIDVREGVWVWRQQLRASVALEARINLLNKVRQWKNDGILIVPLVEFVELLILCILHLENRAGEKILTMILKNATELCGSSKKRFIDSLEAFFQMELLGSPTSPAHWTLPREGRNDLEHWKDYREEWNDLAHDQECRFHNKCNISSWSSYMTTTFLSDWQLS